MNKILSLLLCLSLMLTMLPAATAEAPETNDWTAESGERPPEDIPVPEEQNETSPEEDDPSLPPEEENSVVSIDTTEQAAEAGERLDEDVTDDTDSETEEPPNAESTDTFASLEDDWDNTALFTQYVEGLFYPRFILRSARPDENLTEGEYFVEQQLKAAVAEIASGTRSSTVIYTELGEYAYGDLNMQRLLYTLFKDATYEMYWFSGHYAWGARENNTACFTFYVATDYRLDGEETTVDSARVARAQQAAGNAAEIVSRYEGASDLDRLRAYKDEICALVTYDYDAARQGSSVVGTDPWELVSVFDGDESTNVVCEGYAKAFEYLCNRTAFQNESINCICASGTVTWRYGGGGAHMWNVVTLDDGRNYLVDVTDCDSGSDSFLVHALSGIYDSYEGYTVSTGNRYAYYHASLNSAGAYEYRSDTLTAYPSYLLVLSSYPYGQSEPVIEITEETFPDAAFRAYVMEQLDTDSSRTLSEAELQSVKQIDVASRGITSLKGIAYFGNLEYLNCRGNSLTELDLAANPALQTLYCYDNELIGLDLSANPALRYLSCGNNGLTVLNLSGCQALTWLNCHDNALTELDLTANPALQTLYCYSNALTSLDVSSNPALQTLYGRFNPLTVLTLGENTVLQTLYCEGCQLSALEISGCSQLIEAANSGTRSTDGTVRRVASGGYFRLRFDNTVTLSADGETLWSREAYLYTQTAASEFLAEKAAPSVREGESAEKTLFCGWYADASCTQAITQLENVPTAGAFAKFVTMDVLNTAVQVRQQTLSAVEGASDIRFVTSVPATAYFAKVGFRLTLPSHGDYIVSDHAFKAPLYDVITASGKQYDLALLQKAGLFPDASDSARLAVQTVTGLPARYFAEGNGYLLKVQPYLLTNDGTTVYGREKYFKLYTRADGLRDAVIMNSVGQTEGRRT